MAGKLTAEEAHKMVDQMFARHKKRIEKVEKRTQHFHNLVEVDPVLSEPYNSFTKFQSDAPRRLHTLLKSRLTENRFMFQVTPPRDTADQRKKSDSLETVLNEGIKLAEERQGVDMQGGLSDGQIFKDVGILHWRKAEHLWPPVPDYEYMDEMPEDKDEAERYHETPEDDEQYGKRPYKEKSSSLLERRKAQVARAGFPWFFETPDTATCAWIEDRSAANGLAAMGRRRDVLLLDYKDALKKEGVILSVNQADKRIAIYGEKDAPKEESGDEGGKRLKVEELWTRDEYYELANAGGGNKAWEIVKCIAHPYEMPPFAVVPATEINESAPELRYEPALEGIFRLKPAFDRIITLMLAISEQIALPWYYLKSVGDATPLLDKDGNMVAITQNTQKLKKMPDGYEIAKLEYDLNPAFIQAITFLREEMQTSEPATGRADFGSSGSTKPWTARLQQAQESIEPGRYLRNQARGFAIMGRNIALVMGKAPEDGGFGEGVYVYAMVGDGKLQKKGAVGVEAEDVVSLDVDATIDNTSAAERITKIEHGRELLNDPKVPLQVVKFLEEYMGDPTPDETLKSWMGEQIALQYIPKIVDMRVAAKWGSRTVVGTDGEIVGMGGEPEQPPMSQPPGLMPPGGSGGPAAGMIDAGMMGPLPDQGAIPGAPPMQGVPM